MKVTGHNRQVGVQNAGALHERAGTARPLVYVAGDPGENKGVDVR
jgi:hypothetical protein